MGFYWQWSRFENRLTKFPNFQSNKKRNCSHFVWDLFQNGIFKRFGRVLYVKINVILVSGKSLDFSLTKTCINLSGSFVVIHSFPDLNVSEKL